MSSFWTPCVSLFLEYTSIIDVMTKQTELQTGDRQSLRPEDSELTDKPLPVAGERCVPVRTANVSLLIKPAFDPNEEVTNVVIYYDNQNKAPTQCSPFQIRPPSSRLRVNWTCIGTTSTSGEKKPWMMAGKLMEPFRGLADHHDVWVELFALTEKLSNFATLYQW